MLYLNTSTVYASLHHEQACVWFFFFFDIVNFKKLFFALICLPGCNLKCKMFIEYIAHGYTVETRYKEIWYNKISDITSYFLRSQWNNFLCFVLFIDNWYNKISDITNKISWSQGSRYTEFPLYKQNETNTFILYQY